MAAQRVKAKAKKAAPHKKAKASKSARARVVKAIPDGSPPMMPITVLERCGEAIEFYKRVFGAKERLRMPMPDGKLAHAELGFGPSVLMLADVTPMWGATPAKLCLNVKDCDAVYRAAVEGGGRSTQEPVDQFYGDRSARVLDPFGNEWTIM